jgi:hypothetical protein
MGDLNADADDTTPFGLPIDYAASSADLDIADARVSRFAHANTSDLPVSDHFPIYVDISLSRRDYRVRPKPEAPGVLPGTRPSPPHPIGSQSKSGREGPTSEMAPSPTQHEQPGFNARTGCSYDHLHGAPQSIGVGLTRGDCSRIRVQKPRETEV